MHTWWWAALWWLTLMLYKCYRTNFKVENFSSESWEKPNEIQSRRNKIVCIKTIIERVNELAKSMKMTIQIIWLVSRMFFVSTEMRCNLPNLIEWNAFELKNDSKSKIIVRCLLHVIIFSIRKQSSEWN